MKKEVGVANLIPVKHHISGESGQTSLRGYYGPGAGQCLHLPCQYALCLWHGRHDNVSKKFTCFSLNRCLECADINCELYLYRYICKLITEHFCRNFKIFICPVIPSDIKKLYPYKLRIDLRISQPRLRKVILL